MECPDSVIPEPILRNNLASCMLLDQNTKPAYNDNLSLFRALEVHLHETNILETSIFGIFNGFLESSVAIR